MKNDYQIGGTKISIPPTVLFSAIGIVPDVRLAMTPDFKRPADAIYVLGETRDETGGSEYYAALGYVGNKAPKVADPQVAIRMYRAVHAAMAASLVASCHDLSDGGLGIALAECAFSGGLGARISLANLRRDGVDRDDSALFSESPCRFVVTVRPDCVSSFEKLMDGFPFARIGEVCDMPRLTITGLNGKVVVDADIWELKKKWQEPLGI
jgi:phosphoribosylformylglycinamidine synthase subunit PurSL